VNECVSKEAEKEEKVPRLRGGGHDYSLGRTLMLSFEADDDDKREGTPQPSDRMSVSDGLCFGEKNSPHSTQSRNHFSSLTGERYNSSKLLGHGFLSHRGVGGFGSAPLHQSKR
jgi:hypothetical protein